MKNSPPRLRWLLLNKVLSFSPILSIKSTARYAGFYERKDIGSSFNLIRLTLLEQIAIPTMNKLRKQYLEEYLALHPGVKTRNKKKERSQEEKQERIEGQRQSRERAKNRDRDW